MLEGGDTAVEFSLIDPSILRVAFWGLLPTGIVEMKRASAESGNSFVCQVTKGDGNL